MEETFDLDKSDKDVEFVETDAAAFVTSRYRSRASCTFNQMLGSLNVINEEDCNPLKTYQERVRKEIKEWTGLWRQTRNTIINKTQPIVSVQSLNNKHRTYLEAAPALQIFLRDSVKFRKHANFYLQNDYDCTKRNADQLVEMCEELIENTKQNVINKRAAYQND